MKYNYVGKSGHIPSVGVLEQDRIYDKNFFPDHIFREFVDAKKLKEIKKSEETKWVDKDF